MSSTIRTAVVISNHSGMFIKILEALSFEVLGTAQSVSIGSQLIASASPDVVLVENELERERGLEGLDRMKAAAPKADFVLIVADGLAGLDPGKTGAYAVVPRGRLIELPDLLSQLLDHLDEREQKGADFTERRSSGDRRVAQDWSKVGWDRRKGSRRGVADDNS